MHRSKKTNTELATHIPLVTHGHRSVRSALCLACCSRHYQLNGLQIIRVPWIEASVGVRTKVKIELVDLCESYDGADASLCMTCARDLNPPDRVFLVETYSDRT